MQALLQTLPHEPQFLGSFDTLTSQPFEATRSQSANPGAQMRAQLPDVHTAVAFGPAAQALPQLPQFCGSFFVSAQYGAPPSPDGHWVSAPPHVVTHAPLAHCWPAPHCTPQLPQFALSVGRLAQ